MSNHQEDDSITPSTPHYATKFSSLSGFGLKILGKYGFKTGEGLGRKGEGIKSHVTATKKFHESGMGIGADKEKKPNYWWENAYNEKLISIKEKKRKSSSSSDSDSTSSDSSDDEDKKTKNAKKSKQNEAEKTSKDSDSSSDSSCSDQDEKKEKKKHCKVEGSSVLDPEFFKECEGRTLKKYRQVGKESRAKKHEEDLIQKLKEAKEKMEAMSNQRKFKQVVTEKRKIQQKKIKIGQYRDGDE
ncbi:hypothetical protein C9374_002266 [Naegleria lovaniensis]|uniref:G-patch domain-containing protein n=1 Tax=Naegleria lovaniensis TaxID=51637 RepID=A0AA88GT28_NAELO|nr:uncharacterized protein C9374_002266 [Naegleria lovaniensis]KAG2386522.1 hypothetical protein C9374_002266 [Naegleria lovaniensis]